MDLVSLALNDEFERAGLAIASFVGSPGVALTNMAVKMLPKPLAPLLHYPIHALFLAARCFLPVITLHAPVGAESLLHVALMPREHLDPRRKYHSRSNALGSDHYVVREPFDDAARQLATPALDEIKKLAC